jgi:hypothetical protein
MAPIGPRAYLAGTNPMGDPVLRKPLVAIHDEESTRPASRWHAPSFPSPDARG